MEDSLYYLLDFYAKITFIYFGCSNCLYHINLIIITTQLN